MKINLSELPLKYIHDERGEKTDVVINIGQFEKFLEEVEDIYLSLKALKALEEETEFISQEEVERMLGLDQDQ